MCELWSIQAMRSVLKCNELSSLGTPRWTLSCITERRKPMGKAPTVHDSNELTFWGRQDSGDNAKEQLLGIRRGQREHREGSRQ